MWLPESCSFLLPSHSTGICPLCSWGQDKRDVPQTWHEGFCPFPFTLGLPSLNDWGYPGVQGLFLIGHSLLPLQEKGMKLWAWGTSCPRSEAEVLAAPRLRPGASPGGFSLVPASALTDVPSFTSKELSCYPGGISRAVTQKSFCQKEIRG